MEPITAEVTAPKPTPLRSPESPLVSGKPADYNEDFCLWVEYQAKLLREGLATTGHSKFARRG